MAILGAQASCLLALHENTNMPAGMPALQMAALIKRRWQFEISDDRLRAILKSMVSSGRVSY